MFQLDFRTLLVVLAINCAMAAIALPIIMGRRVGPAARWAQLSVLLQAFTWSGLLMSSFWRDTRIDWALSSLSIACLAGSWLALGSALHHWLGPRPGMNALKALTVLIPLGYTLGFKSYAFRVGWANCLLAVQMLVVVGALWTPSRPTRLHWRALMLVCLVSLAIITFWRGILGAFYTDAYPTFLTPHAVNLASAISSNIALMLITVAILVAWREEAERLLHSQAVTDGLTGVLNRRAWTEAAALALRDAHRHQRDMVVMMIDIDHFKRINDEHGHEAGDRALQFLASQLRLNVRGGDLVGRYGGEEFCLLLSGANADTARALDRRLRDALANTAPLILGWPLDFSAGLAERPAAAVEIDHLLREADAALYRAKRSGRSRLALAEGDLGSEASPRPSLAA